ncbi:helix-turn-helix domain-containing protein [Enterovirga sp. CN4-39]|uniref:helix-turn-helix domain-containing protein n=1 Tax=Enterovirga sp. CN4-39 TaxID=3400910 RepID=UPI003C116791
MSNASSAHAIVSAPASKATLTEEPTKGPLRIVRSAPVSGAGLISALSPREQDIARLVADGLSNKEIGIYLGISHWTVSAHLRHMFVKLSIDRRIDLCVMYRGGNPGRGKQI